MKKKELSMKSSEMSKNDKNSDDFACFLLISEHAIFLAEKKSAKIREFAQCRAHKSAIVAPNKL